MSSKKLFTHIAVIRESECIGCTKCIQACPVDAIMGASKQMHTIFADICTGCELCLPPCPVDCIDLIPRVAEPSEKKQERQQQADAREREHALRMQEKKKTDTENTIDVIPTLDERKKDIAAAVLRTQLKGKSRECK